MKKVLSKLFGKNVEKQKSRFQIINKEGECLLHNTAAFPNIKANHHCLTCNISTCYMCSNSHFENKCDVQWSDTMLNSIVADEKINLFNQGHLAKLNLNRLQCPCGSMIDQEKPGTGICVACGTATCSSECHKKYVEDEHQCNFKDNFTKELQTSGMRSLLFRNIGIMKKMGYSDYTKVTRTSQHFITGLLSDKIDEIYLQRGFRQYGNPLAETAQNMEVINQKNLDYVMNQSRICDCECSACKGKDVHPHFNCEVDCKKKEAIYLNDVSQDERMQSTCSCDCSFCNSGVTVIKHRYIDCMFFCEKSAIEFNKAK